MGTRLADITSRLEPVHRAESVAEREAIFRFRYDIYVNDMHRYKEYADHESRWLHDAEDDLPNTLLLYTGSPEHITGTARVQSWPAGKVPEKKFSDLSMQLFTGIADLNTAEVTRLMISPVARGRFLLPSLIIHGYQYLAGEKNTDLAFFQSIPALVHHFRRLGTRPYGGALLEGGSSALIPSVMVLSDYNYFKQCGSFLSLYVKDYFFGPDKRHPLNTHPFEEIFEDNAIPVELDAMRAWDDIQAELLKDNEHISTFLDELSHEVIREIVAAGMLVTVSAGCVLSKENTTDKQIFLLVDGCLEVTVEDRRVAVLSKGDLFGEIAFFMKTGVRSASVTATSRSKVLAINHRFLRRLMLTQPEGAWQIFMNIGRIMAERLAGMLQSPEKDG